MNYMALENEQTGIHGAQDSATSWFGEADNTQPEIDLGSESLRSQAESAKYNLELAMSDLRSEIAKLEQAKSYIGESKSRIKDTPAEIPIAFEEIDGKIGELQKELTGASIEMHKLETAIASGFHVNIEAAIERINSNAVQIASLNADSILNHTMGDVGRAVQEIKAEAQIAQLDTISEEKTRQYFEEYYERNRDLFHAAQRGWDDGSLAAYEAMDARNEIARDFVRKNPDVFTNSVLKHLEESHKDINQHAPRGSNKRENVERGAIEIFIKMFGEARQDKREEIWNMMLTDPDMAPLRESLPALLMSAVKTQQEVFQGIMQEFYKSTNIEKGDDFKIPKKESITQYFALLGRAQEDQELSKRLDDLDRKFENNSNFTEEELDSTIAGTDMTVRDYFTNRYIIENSGEMFLEAAAAKGMSLAEYLKEMNKEQELGMDNKQLETILGKFREKGLPVDLDASELLELRRKTEQSMNNLEEIKGELISIARQNGLAPSDPRNMSGEEIFRRIQSGEITIPNEMMVEGAKNIVKQRYDALGTLQKIRHEALQKTYEYEGMNKIDEKNEQLGAWSQQYERTSRLIEYHERVLEEIGKESDKRGFTNDMPFVLQQAVRNAEEKLDDLRRDRESVANKIDEFIAPQLSEAERAAKELAQAEQEGRSSVRYRVNREGVVEDRERQMSLRPPEQMSLRGIATQSKPAVSVADGSGDILGSVTNDSATNNPARMGLAGRKPANDNPLAGNDNSPSKTVTGQLKSPHEQAAEAAKPAKEAGTGAAQDVSGEEAAEEKTASAPHAKDKDQKEAARA